MSTCSSISGENSPVVEVKPLQKDPESVVTEISPKPEVEVVTPVQLSKPSVIVKAPQTEISQSSDLLNGIDLDALDLEMDSIIGHQSGGQQKSVLPQTNQQQPQPIQQQPIQQQPIQQQPQSAQPQALQPPSAQPQLGLPQSVQPQPPRPQQPPSFCRSPANSPPATRPLARPSPQQQFPPAMRNQTMLQNIQQGNIIRGPNGQPMIHPPVSGNGQAIQYVQTAQNNAFSTKRNTSFISFHFIHIVT